MCARCWVLKNPCLPVSVPVDILFLDTNFSQIPSHLASTGRKLLRAQRELASSLSVLRQETLRGIIVGAAA
jgi:hypothetical protein